MKWIDGCSGWMDVVDGVVWVEWGSVSGVG